MSDISADLGTGRASVGAVLDYAWTAGEFTATDAMASTAITRSTAIEALATLVGAGILTELPNARAAGAYRAGRPARRFTLCPDLGVVAGIDAGDTHLAVTIADLLDTSLAHRRVDLDPEQTPDERRATILQHLEQSLADAGRTRESLLSICVGVAAPVDREGTSPPHPQGFWERTNPALATALTDWAPVVEVKNDALLAAVAEGSLGAAVGCRDYVALLAGERFGGGVVVDGHLLHGAHGGVGEGVVFDHIVGVGSAVGLSHTVQDEVRSAVEDGEIDRRGLIGRLSDAVRIDPRVVLVAAAEGDRDAVLVCSRVGERLARIVGVLSSMYDPARVIVCGAIAESIQPVITAARAMLPAQMHLPAPDLLASSLGAEVVSLGAVATARRAARERAVPLLAERRLATA
ncbi:ROK family protein [Microbacterium sp. nov. GSS16]|uniref:ROK family protein n=1 Tax=Microbacterium sp. nov. GSS16 TaxID=3019890 RepID=UPI002305EC0E|nr:ROK family protein [Microbacterium sp. nov. GSS16]WCD93522.1 ROK family protein [Microbacterium sp. nov. GSS16]